MKCNQCERPAIYKYSEELSLCLHCHNMMTEAKERESQTRFREFLMEATMLNQAQDDLELALPIGPKADRIPVAALANAIGDRRSVSNQFNISDSNIGVVNSGDLAKIEAAVTLSSGTNVEEIAQNLKTLTELVGNSENIDQANKKELIEIISSVSVEATGQARKSIINIILKEIEKRVGTINGAIDIVSKIAELFSKFA